MKKIISLLMITVLMITMVACGNNSKTDDGTTQGGSNIVASTDENTNFQNKEVTIESVKNAKETDVSFFEYEEVDDGIVITGFNGTDEIVVIPSSIDGKNVISVGEYSFANNSTMKGVKISSTVQVISESAFGNCAVLEVFVSGESVQKIDMYAFNNSQRLRNVYLNEGLQTLGGLCFGLTNLTEIEIPSSVTEINYPFTVNNDEHFITIIAETGSAAEQYVTEKGEEYHLIFQAK